MIMTVIMCYCRPRTGLQEAHSLGDIQRFFMVLLPLSRPAPARLIVVGKKHLPERGQRFWAAVVAVAPTVSLKARWTFMPKRWQGLGLKCQCSACPLERSGKQSLSRQPRLSCAILSKVIDQRRAY